MKTPAPIINDFFFQKRALWKFWDSFFVDICNIQNTKPHIKKLATKYKKTHFQKNDPKSVSYNSLYILEYKSYVHGHQPVFSFGAQSPCRAFCQLRREWNICICQDRCSLCWQNRRFCLFFIWKFWKKVYLFYPFFSKIHPWFFFKYFPGVPMRILHPDDVF